MFSISHSSDIKQSLSPDSAITHIAYSYVKQTHLRFLVIDYKSLLVEIQSKSSKHNLLIPCTHLANLCLIPKADVIGLLSKTHLWILPFAFIDHYNLISEYWEKLIKSEEPQNILNATKQGLKRSSCIKPLAHNFPFPVFVDKKEEETFGKLLANIHVLKLAQHNWKQVHYWEDIKNGCYLICIAENGLFQWISLINFKEELMLQLKLIVKDSYLVQADSLRESYLLLQSQTNSYWKMWLSTKNTKSVLQTNWGIKNEPDTDSDIINVLAGYKVLSMQYMRYNMYGLIAYKDSQAYIFDSRNLDAPIVSYQLDEFIYEDDLFIGIIGKYLLVHSKHKIKIYSQNLLTVQVNKEIDKNIYTDWTYKDYANLDSLAQVLNLEEYESISLGTIIYKGTENVEKIFSQSEAKALTSTAITFATSKGLIEIEMSPITFNTIRHALTTVKSPYELRQLEIFFQSTGFTLNEYMAKLSEILFNEKQLTLAFRYAALSEKEPIQVLSEYLRFEQLYEDIYRWVIQLFVIEKDIHQNRAEQYILVITYILIKINRTDIAPYIKFAEFKKLFKKDKYLRYEGFILGTEKPSLKKLVAEEGLKKYPWILSLARILLSKQLAKWMKEKESFLLGGLNKLVFEPNNFGLPLSKPDKTLDKEVDVIALQREIMTAELEEVKINKFYTRIIPWTCEHLLGFLYQLPYKQRIELFIIKNLLSTPEIGIFYQLKHQFFVKCSQRNYLETLNKISAYDILQAIKTVTFDYRVFSPDKPLIKICKFDQMISVSNGLLSSMHLNKTISPSFFNGTALNYGAGATETKRIDSLKKIRSNLAISYNTLQSKYPSYYSAFLTPYVSALIILRKKTQYPITMMEYQLFKLLSLLLLKLHKSIDTGIVLKLLIETKQWKGIGKIMIKRKAWSEALQALDLAYRDNVEEIANVAISFLVEQRPIEFYVFLLKFLADHSESLRISFEEKLLKVEC